MRGLRASVWPQLNYPPISSQTSKAPRLAASVMRFPALPAISMTCMPRSKYSGSDRRTLSNFSGYSDANAASPTPVASTPAGYFFFRNRNVAAPIEPITTAFFQLSIPFSRETSFLGFYRKQTEGQLDAISPGFG